MPTPSITSQGGSLSFSHRLCHPGRFSQYGLELGWLDRRNSDPHSPWNLSGL